MSGETCFKCRSNLSSYLRLAREFVKVDDKVTTKANYLRGLNFDDLDALHLAVAEGAKADYFLTCDDLIVRKADSHEGKLKVKVMNLLKFVAQEVR